MWMYLLVFLFFLIMGGVIWLVLINYGETKYNGLLWIHPDHDPVEGGHVITIKHKPKGQRPFYMKYGWYYFMRKPIYLWQEVPVVQADGTVTYRLEHWEPDTTNDQSLAIDADGNQIVVTPNILFDTSDWECARRFETVKSGAMEKIKLGMGLAMVGLCILGTFLLVNTIMEDKNKDQAAPPPVQTTPADDKISMNILEYEVW